MLQRFLRKSNIHKLVQERQPQLIIYSNRNQTTTPYNLTSSSSTVSSTLPQTSNINYHPNIDVTFCDCKEAYKSKRTNELLRALLVFNLCSIKILVDKNKELIKFSQKCLGQNLFNRFMKATFYGHFVAGENRKAIAGVIQKNRSYGVKAILDYSAEQDLSAKAAKDKASEAVSTLFQRQKVDNLGGRRYQVHEEFAHRSESVESAKTYYYEGEEQCDKNMNIFIECIDSVADNTKCEGMAAIKLTALGRPQLLLQISDVLAQAHNLYDILSSKDEEKLVDKEHLKSRLKSLNIHLDYDEEKKWLTILQQKNKQSVDMLAWENLMQAQKDLGKIFYVKNLKSPSSESQSTGRMEQIVPELSEEGLAEIKNMLQRTDSIIRHATKQQVRVMIDAEQSYFQPATRRITMELMRKYNTKKNVVFNTYQCYLKSAMEQILVDMNLAEQEDFHFGAKLVRGAYMDQERIRAKSLQYEDPINESYEATSDMYHNVLEEVFKAITRRDKGKIAVMVATHNEDTVRKTIEKMKQYNVMPSDRLICFGQLLGMCDQISFPLGQAGYSVYKYVPYGPVNEVIPYLSRRAVENRGVIQKVKKEKGLLRQELWRRIKSGEIIRSHQHN